MALHGHVDSCSNQAGVSRPDAHPTGTAVDRRIQPQEDISLPITATRQSPRRQTCLPQQAGSLCAHCFDVGCDHRLENLRAMLPDATRSPVRSSRELQGGQRLPLTSATAS